MRKCPHCGNDIMPSVVKCVYCGRSVKDAPQGPPPGPDGPADASAQSGLSDPSAGGGQGEPSSQPPAPVAGPPTQPPAAGRPTTPSPPPSVEFKLPTLSPAQPRAAQTAEGVTAAGAADRQVQTWGTPSGGTADAYWHVKSAPPEPSAVSAPPLVGAPAPAGRGSPLAVVGAVVLALAGIAALAASLQPWVSVSAAGVSRPLDPEAVEKTLGTGIERWDGRCVAALGAACLVLALVWALGGRKAVWIRAGIPCGIVIAAVAVYAVLTATSTVVNAFAQQETVVGMTEQAALGKVTGLVDSGVINVAVQMWLYVVVGAGAAAVIAGLLAFFGKSPAAASGPRVFPGEQR